MYRKRNRYSNRYSNRYRNRNRYRADDGSNKKYMRAPVSHLPAAAVG